MDKKKLLNAYNSDKNRNFFEIFNHELQIKQRLFMTDHHSFNGDVTISCPIYRKMPMELNKDCDHSDNVTDEFKGCLGDYKLYVNSQFTVGQIIIKLFTDDKNYNLTEEIDFLNWSIKLNSY